MTLKDKDNIYKISISVIFGVLGFFVNFHTIIFPFGEYTAAILLGLLFPILITLTWGWKYGLLSALAGGCQSMWWLWGPSNGYAILLVVPPFTLWVVWHGIFAELRRKQKTQKWWLSMYIVEIPFRILSSINLLTLSRWAIALNPPSWSWASDAPNTIPMHFSNFVVIKQAVVGYIILLLADVLLNVGFVRRFFKLKEVYNQTNTGYIISASLLIGALFWLIDSIFGSLIFHSEKTFLELFALNVPSNNIFVRIAFILSCLVGGLLAARLLRKQREGDIALRESEIKYRTLVEHLPAITYTAALDKSSTTLYVNPSIKKIIGISPEEYKTDPDFWVNHLHEEDRERVLGEFGHAHKTGQSLFTEYRMIYTDGRIVWLRDEAVIIKDDKGNSLYAQGIMFDITEQKKTDETLKESEEKLRNIIEHSTNVFYSHTTEHVITYISPQVKEILGYEVSEVMIRWTELASDNPINEKGFELTAKAIETGKSQPPYELELVHKSGKKVWIEVHEGPVVVDGKTISIVGVFTDITERRKAKEELAKHRDHLEEMIQKRTAELQNTINLMAGREVRMAELKEVIGKLRSQVVSAGMTPVADDPLKEI